MTDHRLPDQPPRDVDERLADWVDGRLSERERERLVAEMRVNPQLRADLAQYERTVGVLRAALRAPSTPVRIADRVMDAIAAQKAKPIDGTAARLSGRGLWWSLMCAAALLLGAVWLNSLQPAPGSRTVVATDAGPVADAAVGSSDPTSVTAPVVENLVAHDSLGAGIKPVPVAGDPASDDPTLLVVTKAATREEDKEARDKDVGGSGLGISPPPTPVKVEPNATEGRALGGKDVHAKRAAETPVPQPEVALVQSEPSGERAKEDRRGEVKLGEGFERSAEPGAGGGARPTAPTGSPPGARVPAPTVPTPKSAPSPSLPSAPSTPAVSEPEKGRDLPVADGIAPSEDGGTRLGSRARGAVVDGRRQAEPGHVPLILVEGDAVAAAPVATEAQRSDPLRKSNAVRGFADQTKNDAKNEPAGAVMDAQALQVAVAGFLTASSDPSQDPTPVSFATDSGTLRLSPLLEGRYELADRQTNDKGRDAVSAPKLALDRTWLVEGARADVEILLAQLAKWTRERKATMRSGETTPPVAASGAASVANAPADQKRGTDQELAAAKPASEPVRLIVRLKLRAAK